MGKKEGEPGAASDEAYSDEVAEEDAASDGSYSDEDFIEASASGDFNGSKSNTFSGESIEDESGSIAATAAKLDRAVRGSTEEAPAGELDASFVDDSVKSDFLDEDSADLAAALARERLKEAEEEKRRKAEEEARKRQHLEREERERLRKEAEEKERKAKEDALAKEKALAEAKEWKRKAAEEAAAAAAQKRKEEEEAAMKRKAT